MVTEPGTKVLITQDCRTGGVATGQIGTYEGDYPYTAIICLNGEYREYDYELFVRWNATQENPFPEYSGGDKPAVFYIPNNNPRIRLPDGSVIWGAECWWGEAEGAPPLEEAQRQTEIVKLIIREALTATGTADGG